MLHIGIWGPYKVPSLSGARYILTIVYDFSRYVWVYLMQHKGQVTGLLTKCLNYVKNHFDTMMKHVRSDNGMEFIGHSCQQLFDKHGILHQKSCVYTPQQNGVVERKHKHLAQVARALLHHAGMTNKFWGEAILIAAHIINRLNASVELIGNVLLRF